MKKNMLTTLAVVIMAGILLLGFGAAVFAETDSGITETGDVLKVTGIPMPEDAEAGADENQSAPSYSYSAVYSSDKWDPYSCWYVYNRLYDAEQQVWDGLYTACVKKANDTSDNGDSTDRVPVSNWTLSKLEQFYELFRLCNPQFYFLGLTFYYSGNTTNITAFRPILYENFQNAATRSTATDYFMNKVTDWVDTVRQAGSEYAMAVTAHDIIKSNVSYNYTVYDEGRGDTVITNEEEQQYYTQSAYSAACLGTTVCAGYSQLYAMLCNAVNIDTFSVESPNHQWNKCRVSDVWCNVDVTWDDGGYGYSFFCRSDSAMLNLNSGSHTMKSPWSNVAPACTIDSGAGTGSCGWISAPSAVLATPTVSLTRSEDQVTVTIYSPNGGTVYYTTDGTTPSQANSRSRIYSDPFPAVNGTTIRAVAVANGWTDSAISAALNVVITPYPITYHLDKGTNAAGNPDKIYEGSSVTLRNPTRDGAYFCGWYLDANLTQPVTTLTTGMPRTNGGYHLYAKWELLTVSGWTYSILNDGTAQITACTLTGDLVIPETIHGRTVTEMAGDLFANRKDITTVTLPSGMRAIRELGYYFWYCTSLKAIYVNENNTQYTSKSGVLFSKDLSTLIFYPMGKTTVNYATPAETTYIQKYALLLGGKLSTLRLTNPNITWNTERFREKLSGEVIIITAGGTAEQTVREELSAGFANNIGSNTGYPYYAVISESAPNVKSSIKTGSCAYLSWSKISGVDSYVILRRTSANRLFSSYGTAGTTNFLDTDTREGKSYYYIVGCKDSATGLLHVREKNATGKKVSIPKVAPTIKGSVTSSTGRVKITWTAVENAEKYYIWRNPGGNYRYKVGTTTGTSWTDTTAEPGTENKYLVQVVLKSGFESQASEAVFLTTRCAAPAVTISNVAASGKPKLSWKAVSGATAYKVYRATSEKGSYKLIATTENTSYTNTGAKVNTKYYYKVKAICSVSDGNSSYSTVKAVTVDLAKPTVKITTASGKPKLTWEAVSGATKYKVYRATSRNGSYSLLKTVTARSYKDTSAKKGKTYYYRIQAISNVSDAASARSTVKSIKCTK